MRISKLIEMFQYSFIGTFFVLLIMYLLSFLKSNLIFDKITKITNNDGMISIFCKISLEVFIVSIIVFYIRKLIMILPSILVYLINLLYHLQLWIIHLMFV